MPVNQPFNPVFPLVYLFLFFCAAIYPVLFAKSMQRRALKAIERRKTWPFDLRHGVIERLVRSEWYVIQYRIGGCLLAMFAVFMAILVIIAPGARIPGR
jgi:hypothetical protein